MDDAKISLKRWEREKKFRATEYFRFCRRKCGTLILKLDLKLYKTRTDTTDMNIFG